MCGTNLCKHRGGGGVRVKAGLSNANMTFYGTRAANNSLFLGEKNCL